MKRFIPLAAIMTACGYTDGGGGTRSLEVVADISYRAWEDGNRMRVEITVEKEGLTINGARVELIDGETEELFLVSQTNDGEAYREVQDPDDPAVQHMEGYRRRLELKVESGEDKLNAKLEGPGRHIIEAPKNDETFARDDLGDIFDVEWSTTDGIAAKEVLVRLHEGEYESTITEYGDPGDVEIPVSKLRDGGDNVRITRRNNVRLDGGRGGSIFEIAYEARNSFVIE